MWVRAAERAFVAVAGSLWFSTLTSTTVVQGSVRRTRVLVLYQQQAETQPMLAFTSRLRASVTKALGSPVEFYQEALDLDRFTGREHSPPLRDYLQEKYRGFGIDIVVPVGGRALRFALDHLTKALPNVPVVFALGGAPRLDPANLPAHVTGRFAAASRFAPTVALARALQPDAERVVVVGGAGPADSVSVAAAVSAVARWRDAPPLTVLQGLSLATVLARLRQLSPRTIVIFANFREGAHGNVFEPFDLVGSLARASAAPMYVQLRSYVGEGVVGGSVTSFEDEGTLTGRLVVRVLRRLAGERMPPAERIGQSFVVDSRQLRRWRLSERRLPPGTVILFREPSSWQRYRAVILLAIGLIGAESLLIGLLLLERRRRKRAQSAIEEQAAYEHTIAQLTADVAHHALEDAPVVLGDALARVATYAGASEATLVQYGEAPPEPPLRLSWMRGVDVANGNASSTDGSTAVRSDAPLAIPLVADGTVLGALELRRSDTNDTRAWPTTLARRLDSAGEIIATEMSRARAARVIRRVEEVNRAVLRSLSTQIAILDHRGTIVRVNDAWRDVANRAQVDDEHDAFVGRSYLDECQRAMERGCDQAADVRCGIEAVLDGHVSPFRREYHCSAPNDRWYEIFVDRLQLPEGGAIVTHVDVTDRHLAEEARLQVAHLGRVAVIGELAATISHELRQPLAAIRANAEAGDQILAKLSSDVGEVREIFQSIVADDVRAVEVIEGVRKLLRKGEPLATTVDLNQTCRHAARLLQADADHRNTRLELFLAPAPLLVIGDPVQLQQVVLNLVLNAMEAASDTTEDRLVTVSTAQDEGEAEIGVSDTGPGLPADVEQHLFESFFSTKPQGLGMGLVIVRSIVERHHGRVRVENSASGGAIVRIRLPTAR